jgi:transcriptional regulator with XRE-family HTH domain
MPEKKQVVDVARHFGDNLRRIRRREDLSQEELARRASLHRTEIGKLENTERVPRIDTLVQLAGAMAVPPGELLDGIDWVPGPEPEGNFTFRGGLTVRNERQLSSPSIDEDSEQGQGQESTPDT